MVEVTRDNVTIRLIVGDITRESSDAIANAANSGLRGGGGVDGAIHRLGGPSIMAELDQIRAQQGGCPTGSAVLTGAGHLSAKYVIHAVGPVWSGGEKDEDALLASAYRTCIQLAAQQNCRSIAFPSISTGIYGFPTERAAPLALGTTLEAAGGTSVEEIRFVLFDSVTYDIFQRALAELEQSG